VGEREREDVAGVSGGDGNLTSPNVLRALRRSLADRTDRSLIIDTVGTLGLNVSTIVLNLAVVLLLTHMLGADGFGAYASAFAWSGILSVFAVLGLTPLVIRHVAGYSTAESWPLLRGLLRRSNQAVCGSSALIVGSAVLVGLGIYRNRPPLLDPYLVGLALVPLVALTSLRQAAMQGLGRVVLGRVPEALLAPVLFISLIVAADALLGTRFTAVVATALQVAGTLVAFVAGAWLLRRSLPAAVRTTEPAYDIVSWRRSAVPLLLLNLFMAANAQVGTIMLGALGNARDAGVFNVAFRVTTFISFVMLAATYPLSPTVARLHIAGERNRIQATVVRTARLVLLGSIPVAIVLVVFPAQVLSLFGSGFGGGAAAVRIMAAGDLVNVVTGFGGLVLVMSGRESDLARGVALGAMLNLGLAAVLVPMLGVNGAALATAAGLAAANVLMTWLAWRRLGIWAGVTSFGLLKPAG
jgi:O-antigen/teichoic acid export membrane protein